jgi:hypothetical protein
MHDDIDDVHALAKVAQSMFENAGLRLGRDPEQELSATEAAKVLRVAKRVLRAIDPKDLPYETAGSGGHREHRRYRLRDCLEYVACSRQEKTNPKST